MPKKILVIDREPQTVQICRDYLQAAGFQVVSAKNGLQGLSAVRQELPVLLIIELSLPDMSGFEFCRTLRRESNLPFIILTSRDGVADKLMGLELGADDYVTKPFSPRELVARIQMVLRRTDRSSLTKVPDG